MRDDVLTLMTEPLPEGDGWRVLSPSVGLYAQAPREGGAIRAGEDCARLVVLDRVLHLQLPDGVAGFVASPPPERKHQPVGYGEVLFELRAAAGDSEFGAIAVAASEEEAGGLVVRAAQAGRFYRRPDPDAPWFVEDGAELTAGRTLGLLEVMKTFNPVKYQPGGKLPERARLLRFLVDDGTDVDEGQPLLEVEAT